MNLPDFLSDPDLTRLRESIGASLGRFQAGFLPDLDLSVIEKADLAESGIEIPLDDVQTDANGTLIYKNGRVVLYIRTPRGASFPRYHICNCPKLRQMRLENRFDRYTVSSRENGTFEIEREGKRTIQPLDVCQYCLETLSWEGFSHNGMTSIARARIAQTFPLRKFFDTYGRFVTLNTKGSG
jgi:hypothetical protein